MYVGTDEGPSQSKEIRKAYKEQKPNCVGERGSLLCEMVNL